MSRPVEALLCVVLAMPAVACGVGSAGEDVGPPDGEDELDAGPRDELEGDPTHDDDAGPSSGPLTLVAEEVGATAERVFDVDGDGEPDNALADLGSPSAALVASFLSAAMQAYISDGRQRHGLGALRRSGAGLEVSDSPQDARGVRGCVRVRGGRGLLRNRAGVRDVLRACVRGPA
jgi:hypothetical protein